MILCRSFANVNFKLGRLAINNVTGCYHPVAGNVSSSLFSTGLVALACRGLPQLAWPSKRSDMRKKFKKSFFSKKSLNGFERATKKYSAKGVHISRKSPYTPYTVDNQQLKSLHNSLQIFESPYIVDGKRLKSLHYR
jgi:hypothetical protein